MIFELQCGSTREIKVSTVANSRVATIEFHDRVFTILSAIVCTDDIVQESVPAALTKDKKRINDQEISVHIAWQSTLYVTNFPEKTDDGYIRELFGQVRDATYMIQSILLTAFVTLVWPYIRRAMAKQKIQGIPKILLRPVCL